MTPGRELTPAVDSDMHEIANMLSHFQMQHKETEQKERAAFERRNADLWEGIEKAVRDAETRAEHEAEQLAAARKRQEQAKADAKKARELEMARIAEEKKAAEERKAAEAAAQRARAEQDKAEEVFNTMRGGEHVWPQAAREYAHWQERMRYVKQDILPQVKANADWRKQCFAAKRAITPKIGQLTNERQQIQRVTTEVAAILTQARSVPDKHASTVLYYWMLNHLAKSLIRQAEQEVAARQETAFPLARTALGLMLLGHDTLGEVLMARLVKKCPFVLAYVPERKAGVDEAAYRKTLGLKVDGEETVHMYATRMTGIAALYFACLQSSLVSVAETISVGANLPALAKHLCAPFRPDRLWTWSVRCTTPPITQQPLLPALWSTFLEVAGPAYLQRFGTQARKLLAMLFHAGIQQQKLAPVTEKEEVSQRNAIKAASVRLRLILESWEQRGNLDEYASGGLCMDS
ncbi:hypothetical protein MVES_000681 [Malassezia vespertilionis]|uniref:mRNA export factor GLE1 n=2 Tax=Malassezia vespertilionis TaxID=2020962 RepID=A0A2N1JFX2_9BASI|nr:hypothetical protein MVES_000681 [Malassezia vespertilionis]